MRKRSSRCEFSIFDLVLISLITKSACEQARRTAFACIGSDLMLDCPNSRDRIEILEAIVADSRCYKHPSSTCCPDRGDCSGPVYTGHRSLLDRLCTGRSSCRLQTDRMILDCPTRGRRPYDNDYENVTYRCLPGDEITAKGKLATVPREEGTPAKDDEQHMSTGSDVMQQESNVTASYVIYTAAQRKGGSAASRRMHLIFGTFAAVSVLLNCVLFSIVYILKRKRRQSTSFNPNSAAAASTSGNIVCSNNNSNENSNRRDPGLDPGHWYEPLTIRIDQSYNHAYTYINDIRTSINDIRTSSIYQDIIY